MFNLEQSIAEWRRQMLAAGIKTPVPMEELESHLREDIADHMQSGAEEQQAFETAALRIGCGDPLKSEFAKVGAAKEKEQMKRVVAILAGLFGVLFGFALIWPQLGMLHRTGAIPSAQALLAGVAIAVAAGCVTFYNIRKHTETHGRRLVAVCLVGVGGLCSLVNLSTLFELSSTEWLWWPPVVGVIVVYFAVCLYVNRTLALPPAREV
jgi:hypothetical protein